MFLAPHSVAYLTFSSAWSTLYAMAHSSRAKNVVETVAMSYGVLFQGPCHPAIQYFLLNPNFLPHRVALAFLNYLFSSAILPYSSFD